MLALTDRRWTDDKKVAHDILSTRTISSPSGNNSVSACPRKSARYSAMSRASDYGASGKDLQVIMVD